MHATITTPRTRLRPLTLQDGELMYALVNSEGWVKYISQANVHSLDDAGAYIEKRLASPNCYYNVIELLTTGEAIGIVTLLDREGRQYPDVGFALFPHFEGQGYAFEATDAYIKAIAAATTHTSLLAVTLPVNQNSIALLQKLGFLHHQDVLERNELLSLYIKAL
jgi:[ribosomal protein S5]-alanine N-acetyltransferase